MPTSKNTPSCPSPVNREFHTKEGKSQALIVAQFVQNCLHGGEISLCGITFRHTSRTGFMWKTGNDSFWTCHPHAEWMEKLEACVVKHYSPMFANGETWYSLQRKSVCNRDYGEFTFSCVRTA